MSNYHISKADAGDAASTLQMFVSITDHLLASGVDQWNYDYPNIKTIEEDIALGAQFVIKIDGRVAASIVLNGMQEEQYKKVHWHYRDDAVMVIHRLGVIPDLQGQGLGRLMCEFAERYAESQNYKTIRLDAYAGNVGSNALYRKLGYRRAGGYCYFRKKVIPFYCYDKQILKQTT